MSQHLAWYVSRATGVVAWGLLIASMLWGFLYAVRALGGRTRPWWMLGVHRFLGALALTFVVVHMLAIIADNYTSFGLVDVLVPFASSWQPIPVALGIVGFYVLVTVEITSLMQKRLPRNAWRQIHLASYGLLAFATLHSIAAGTDVGEVVFGGLAIGVATVVSIFCVLTWVWRSESGMGRVRRRVPTSVPR